MCVGISGKVLAINEGTAVIDATGARREVDASLLENVEPGDMIMVHAGIAIAKIESSSEVETQKIMENLDGQDS